MSNSDIQAASSYHQAHGSIRANTHLLDRANQSLPFKVYRSLDLITLPRDFRETGLPALRAIADIAQSDNFLPGLHTLSQLLYFTGQVSCGGAPFLVARSISVRLRARACL
jgi:hypothetical protein